MLTRFGFNVVLMGGGGNEVFIFILKNVVAFLNSKKKGFSLKKGVFSNKQTRKSVVLQEKGDIVPIGAKMALKQGLKLKISLPGACSTPAEPIIAG
jgi:hypothetical protein